jgi:hypothetical protein
MGFKRVETLGDVVRFGLVLTVTCQACGRRREVRAGALYKMFPPSTPLRAIGRRMVCHGVDLQRPGCGHRGAQIDFTFPDPPDPPDDGGGKVVEILPRLLGSQAFYDHASRRRRRRG